MTCTDRGSLVRGFPRTVEIMDNRVEVSEYSTSKRAKITTQQAGMPDVAAHHVPGLRRGEVAALEGVSRDTFRSSPSP